MPIFEYKCEKCEAKFEKLISSTNTKVVCEKCGSKKVEKQLSSFSAKVNEGGSNSCSVSDCASCCPSGTCGL
jgi:putative FmdB family regulatory protein